MDRLTGDRVKGVADSLVADDGSVTFLLQGDGNLAA